MLDYEKQQQIIKITNWLYELKDFFRAYQYQGPIKDSAINKFLQNIPKTDEGKIALQKLSEGLAQLESSEFSQYYHAVNTFYIGEKYVFGNKSTQLLKKIPEEIQKFRKDVALDPNSTLIEILISMEKQEPTGTPLKTMLKEILEDVKEQEPITSLKEILTKNDKLFNLLNDNLPKLVSLNEKWQQHVKVNECLELHEDIKKALGINVDISSEELYQNPGKILQIRSNIASQLTQRKLPETKAPAIFTSYIQSVIAILQLNPLSLNKSAELIELAEQSYEQLLLLAKNEILDLNLTELQTLTTNFFQAKNIDQAKKVIATMSAAPRRKLEQDLGEILETKITISKEEFSKNPYLTKKVIRLAELQQNMQAQATTENYVNLVAAVFDLKKEPLGKICYAKSLAQQENVDLTRAKEITRPLLEKLKKPADERTEEFATTLLEMAKKENTYSNGNIIKYRLLSTLQEITDKSDYRTRRDIYKQVSSSKCLQKQGIKSQEYLDALGLQKIGLWQQFKNAHTLRQAVMVTTAIVFLPLTLLAVSFAFIWDRTHPKYAVIKPTVAIPSEIPQEPSVDKKTSPEVTEEMEKARKGSTKKVEDTVAMAEKTLELPKQLLKTNEKQLTKNESPKEKQQGEDFTNTPWRY